MKSLNRYIDLLFLGLLYYLQPLLKCSIYLTVQKNLFSDIYLWCFWLLLLCSSLHIACICPKISIEINKKQAFNYQFNLDY